MAKRAWSEKPGCETGSSETAKKPRVWDGTISWGEDGASYFSMGEGTLRIPMAMHLEHRLKLTAALKGTSGIDPSSVVFLQGGDEISVYDTDTAWDFRQESNFQYLFGVKEPGCFAALRVSDARAVLFIPEHPKDFAAWMGPIRPPEWFRQAYGVDAVHYVKEIPEVLKNDLGSSNLLVYTGTNLDSGESLSIPNFAGIESFKMDKDHLFDALNECRLIKTEEELKVLQYVNDVSSLAHIEVMRKTRGNMREFVAEATFRYLSFLRGCSRVGYNCICPAGPRNTILHYGWAAEPNAEKQGVGDLKLHDMGAEYHVYTADVTCTFPVSGTFSPEQKAVYEAVWAATLTVERTCRPGIDYKDMHRLAQKVLLEEMTAAGLFKGNIEDMIKTGLVGYFMPHGLGHNLGLNVHDVAGYPPGVTRKDDPSIKQNLRLGRVLQENMVLTVEPGFYFTPYLIEEALANPETAQFIDRKRLDELIPVGGIRIEDDVVITSDGCRVLTNVPRTVDEIEAVMAGQEWAPNVFRIYKNK